MDLYKEILIEVLKNELVQIRFPNLKINPTEIMKIVYYQALNEIKNIIEDDELEDPDCFEKIEKIVRLFESLGSNGGNRHDFG